MESFFGTLKTELVHQCDYPDRDTARRELFAYIRLLQSAADPLRYRLHHPGAGRPENRITWCPLFRGKVTSSSTIRSANSRSVQRLLPSGGSEQASATSFASCSPSSLRA